MSERLLICIVLIQFSTPRLYINMYSVYKARFAEWFYLRFTLFDIGFGKNKVETKDTTAKLIPLIRFFILFCHDDSKSIYGIITRYAPRERV